MAYFNQIFYKNKKKKEKKSAENSLQWQTTLKLPSSLEDDSVAIAYKK